MSLATLLLDLGNVLIACAFVLFAGYVTGSMRGNEKLRRLCDTSGNLVFIAGEALWSAGWFMQGNWALGIFDAAVAAFVAWTWWKRRRRRRERAPKLAGYKARAALAKLAQRAREAAQPRRVLRPVPGGAR